jgi:D-3-phosphoglycerate dehydrogenase / 2-oxoglutarate reductase
MVGRVGSKFGERGVNISAAAVGRAEGDTHADLAVMAVTTDAAVPEAVVSEIARSDGFVSGRSISLD